MTTWTLLLPPSETKALGGTGQPVTRGSLSFPELSPARRTLIGALQSMPVAQQLTAIGLKPTQAQWVDDNYAIWESATLPALMRYTGVLYDALAAQDFCTEQWSSARRHVVVASALWGLVRGSDQIPRYRLSASSRPLGKGNTLAKYWMRQTSRVLAELPGPVVDLRSQSYAALSAAQPNTISVNVVDIDGGKALNHWNKHAKGKFTRQLVIDDATGLEFSPERSAETIGFRWEQTSEQMATLFASRQ